MQDRKCSTATAIRERSTNVSCLALRPPVSTVVSPTPCVHAVGGGRAHRRHPARVAAEERLDSSLAREVLDILQMSATTEHDREAAMPLLIPL
jgi:hypothetical protein